MSDPAVRVRGVWKRFGVRDGLADVTLDVAAGTCVSVLGSNGSGKTTLLRVLSTLIQPTEGSIEVLGHELPRGATEARARIGVVTSRHLLPRDFTLAEGLRLYADLHAVPDAARRIEELTERLDLAHRVRDPLRTFSRGMGQRAALCRALLHDPELLLLDEPFTGLDAEGCDVVTTVAREMRAAGRTVLVATHDLARSTALADRAIVLDQGAVTFDGDPAEAAAAVAGTAA